MASSLSTHAVNCKRAERSTAGAHACSRPSWPPQLRGCDAHVGCTCKLAGLHMGSEIANVAVSVGGPMISATSCAPIRSSFFLSDFSSRRTVFGVARESIAASKQRGWLPMGSTVDAACDICTLRVFPDSRFPISRFLACAHRACRPSASPPPRPHSPRCALHACAPAHASTAHSARSQYACARLAGDAHALTRQHTLARQKLEVMLEALATG